MVRHRRGGQTGNDLVDRHVGKNSRWIDSGMLAMRGRGALETHFAAECFRDLLRCVRVFSVEFSSVRQLDRNRRRAFRRRRGIVSGAKFEQTRKLFRAGYLPRHQLPERISAIADRAARGELQLVELLTEHRFDRVTREPADLADDSSRHRCLLLAGTRGLDALRPRDVKRTRDRYWPSPRSRAGRSYCPRRPPLRELTLIRSERLLPQVNGDMQLNQSCLSRASTLRPTAVADSRRGLAARRRSPRNIFPVDL